LQSIIISHPLFKLQSNMDRDVILQLGQVLINGISALRQPLLNTKSHFNILLSFNIFDELYKEYKDGFFKENLEVALNKNFKNLEEDLKNGFEDGVYKMRLKIDLSKNFSPYKFEDGIKVNPYSISNFESKCGIYESYTIIINHLSVTQRLKQEFFESKNFDIHINELPDLGFTPWENGLYYNYNQSIDFLESDFEAKYNMKALIEILECHLFERKRQLKAVSFNKKNTYGKYKLESLISYLENCLLRLKKTKFPKTTIPKVRSEPAFDLQFKIKLLKQILNIIGVADKKGKCIKSGDKSAWYVALQLLFDDKKMKPPKCSELIAKYFNIKVTPRAITNYQQKSKNDKDKVMPHYRYATPKLREFREKIEPRYLEVIDPFIKNNKGTTSEQHRNKNNSSKL